MSDTSLIFNIVAKDKASRTIGQIKDKIGVAAAGIGAAIAGAIGVGLVESLDVGAANAKLAAQLQLGPAEAAEMSKVSAGIYKDAWGDSTAEVNAAIRNVYLTMGDTALAEEGLDVLTVKAMAMSETLEYDVTEASMAAGQMIKNGLADTGTEAMDLLAAAGAKLPPALSAEIPSLITEYGQFFSQLGATGPQMMGLLTAAAESPNFQLDRLGDTVKELTLRLSETEAVSEPLEELGLNVADIQEMVNTGKGTQAFDEIAFALSDVADQTERTALVTALMGGPGEDAQAALQGLAEAGGFAGTEMKDFEGTVDQMATTLESDPSRALEKFKRSVMTELTDVGGQFARFAMDNQGVVKPLAITLGGLAAVILAIKGAMLVAAAAKTAWTMAVTLATVAQWAYNAALLANPMTWVVIGIMALIAAIVLIATKTTWFQDAWAWAMDAIGAAWDWIWNLLKQGFQWLTNMFMNWTGPGLLIKHWDTIKAAPGAAMKWTKDKVRDGINWVKDKFEDLKALPGKVEEWMSGVGGKIGRPFKDGFRDALNWIIGKWNNLSFTIPSLTVAGVKVFGGATISTPDIPYLAKGGIIQQAGMAVVGEAGPELVHLSQGAQVTPLSRAGTGGGAITLQIDITGGDEELRRRIRRMVRVDGRGDVQVAFGRS
ncbi:hypothetical protein [Streptomyces carpaticus]|uniref:hypothetical protein n=1 Tax=Streptomyces carpaticus TaxID=285558 RepID=UPI0031F7D4AD